MKISVCIPMYNESAIAADTARTLHAAMTAACRERNADFEIIFCDDGSTDNCTDKVRRAAGAIGDERIIVIRNEENHGKGKAVHDAVMASGGDIVVYTDCDLAYGTEVIGNGADIVAGGADFVIGSRNLTSDGYEGYTRFRRFASKMYIKLLATLGGFKLSDSQCGFKALRGDAAKKIFAVCKTEGFAFDFEVIMLAMKFGYKIDEMPVRVINHRASTVHAFSDSFKMIGDVIRIKRHIRAMVE